MRRKITSHALAAALAFALAIIQPHFAFAASAEPVASEAHMSAPAAALASTPAAALVSTPAAALASMPAVALASTPAVAPAAALASTPAASPTSSAVLVNGRNITFDAYNIGGYNYFKLRDLAYVLNGTEKQFEVGWDSAKDAISLISGKPYTAAGGEMKGKGSGVKTPSPTSSKITLDGKDVRFTAYNIDGNNYFKLRDVGQALNFSVEWDDARGAVVIDTAKGYSGAGAEWKALYLKELLAAQEFANLDLPEDHADGAYPRYLSGFSLADLDFDGTPELIIAGETVAASFYKTIYKVMNGEARVIFHDLVNDGPALYRDNRDNSNNGDNSDGPALHRDGSLFYSITVIAPSADDHYLSKYSFTVYKVSAKTDLTKAFDKAAEKLAEYSIDYGSDITAYAFNGRDVGEEEFSLLFDGLYGGSTELQDYPLSISSVFEDRDWDTAGGFTESELMQFLNAYH